MKIYPISWLLRRAQEEGLSIEFVAISGSHSWGLATEESDIDYRGVYSKPLSRILSLHPGRDTWQGNEGAYDWQLYEILKTLRMLCSANGNVVQMFLNPLTVFCTQWGEVLRHLAKQCVTQRLANYYLGYATSQRKRAMRNRGGKALVYTFREGFCGTYLMAEGEIIFDFNRLRGLFEDRWFKSEVLPWALANRHIPMPPEVEVVFEKEWALLQTVLRGEVTTSKLPKAEPNNFVQQCDELLWDYRRRNQHVS